MTTVSSIATGTPASFDLRPFGRMLWKEYRQQRTLWLGLLIFGACLQLIARIAISMFLDPNLYAGTSPPQTIVLLYIIPLYLPPFFLIASTAMLFALEREERTSDWLLNLAAPAWPTLLAKYGSAIAGAASLLLVLWTWAAVLSVGSGYELKNAVGAGVSLSWAAVGTLGVLSIYGTGFLLWGTLGSLTSRRVVTAVPAALTWWLALFLLPVIGTNYFFWWWARFSFEYNQTGGANLIALRTIAACFIGAAVLNVALGLRWCRGQYLDASWLDDLNERLTAMLPWNRGRTSRVPVAIESELSGWRTWQRLVWQEQHRESLHTGLLVIVCATSVLLALYSIANREGSITFAVTLLIAALPLVMGVLGFRFDSGNQQLRFLAGRGMSPTMIWLAKHVVWLPRAFWIPVVCWAVACFAEWVFIPWSGSPFDNQHNNDGLRHPLCGVALFQREHFFDVLWFVLMSYAVGQAAAMLFRRMILAVGAGLMATILLIWWQILVNEAQLPRWWAVGGIAVWLMCLTGWYSRHWLIERRDWSVAKRLTVGLTLPPMLLLFGCAVYRWLEIPGLGPSSPILMSLLYPHEAERREALLGPDITGNLSPIREAINAVTQPTSAESLSVRDRLVSLNRSYRPLSQIRVSPELVASLPTDSSREEQDRAARERFWSFNEKLLAVIMEVLSNELPTSYRTQRTGTPYADATPNPQLLLDAGRLSMEANDPQQAFRYYMTGLRLARCFASQGTFWYWVSARERQSEILQSLVEWSNHEDVTREKLLAAISQTRDELSRFPSLREASAAEFVLGFESESWMRQQLDNPDDPALLRFAKRMAPILLPQEFARRGRMNEQALYWRWHLYGSLEQTLRSPGCNSHQHFVDQTERLAGVSGLHRHQIVELDQTRFQSRLGFDLAEIVLSSEVVNRQTLLALAMVLWKKEHGGELPDSLEDLAPYCVIEGRNEPTRVLPVWALNDPWTGAMFHYTAMRRSEDELIEPDHLNPVVIVPSAGATTMGHADRAAYYATDNGIAFIGQSVVISIRSHQGRLSLFIPERTNR